MKPTYKIIISNKAKLDISLAAKYYDLQKKGLGKKFIHQVRKKMLELSKFPYATTVIHQDKLFPSTKVFPFFIIITINKSNKTIIVWAVLHHNDDPNKWP